VAAERACGGDRAWGVAVTGSGSVSSVWWGCVWPRVACCVWVCWPVGAWGLLVGVVGGRGGWAMFELLERRCRLVWSGCVT